MVGMNGTDAAKAYAAYSSQPEAAKEAEGTKRTGKSKSEYGRTIGEPQLSEKGKKYYEQLKKKYGNYDFILVSSSEMENAKANASKYANRFKPVVLIDEDKIEKMATDENFRKKYEGILSGAQSQLEQLKTSMEKSGANVKGYGMQVNDNGTLSFFAVLKDSSAAQKARIEKKAEQAKAEKKAADKKAEKKAAEERLHRPKADKGRKIEDEEDTVTFSADSIEELLQKIADHSFAERSNNVQTESEKQVGQNIDFRG